MTSRWSILVQDSAGTADSSKYVYVYKHGLYVNSGDRVLCVNANNGVYWFDVENVNLYNADGSCAYDIGIYATDPGATADHTTPYGNQKADEKEFRIFPSEKLIKTVLIGHINNTANPHSVTISQAIAKDTGTDITTAELEELSNGSTTTLHTHAGTTPSAHASTHEAGGSDIVIVKNDNLPLHDAAGAVEAAKIHVADSSGYYTEDDTESVLQEVGGALWPSLSTPVNITATGVEIGGLVIKVMIEVSWTDVTGAQFYDVGFKLVGGSEYYVRVPGTSASKILQTNSSGYQVRVRAGSVLGYSTWSSYVDVAFVLTAGLPDLKILKALKMRLDKVCDDSGAPAVPFAMNINAIAQGRAIVELPLFAESTTDVHTSDPASTTWENVIVSNLKWEKTSAQQYLKVLCNFYSTSGVYGAELGITFIIGNTGLLSPVIGTTSTNDTNEIVHLFNIGKDAGSAECNVKYRNIQGGESAKVNNLHVWTKE